MADIAGKLIFVTCLAVPLMGCTLAVATKQSEWLWLLTPLLIFMEGGIALGLVAIVVVSILMVAIHG